MITNRRFKSININTTHYLRIKHTYKFNKIKIDGYAKEIMQCNAWLEIKDQILLNSYICITSFLLVFYTSLPLWHQVSKKSLIIFRRRWRRHGMIIRICHITRRRRTMRKDIVEMVGEPCELLLNILDTCGESSKLICKRIHITPNSTKICIERIKLLHNRLMILLIERWVKAGHIGLHTLLNDIHNLRHKRIKNTIEVQDMSEHLNWWSLISWWWIWAIKTRYNKIHMTRTILEHEPHHK
jgi:hypothetical protein